MSNHLRAMLQRCRDQFDFYARQHRAKVPTKFARGTPEAVDAHAKANINEDLAREIGVVLNVQSADVVHAEMVTRLQKPGEAIMAQVTPLMLATLHMGVGVGTEAGELNDALKRWIFYGKVLDRDNVIEELGDIEFYLEGIRQNLMITREETLRANHHKLVGSKQARYKDGYSDQAAIARADKQDEVQGSFGTIVGEQEPRA